MPTDSQKIFALLRSREAANIELALLLLASGQVSDWPENFGLIYEELQRVHFDFISHHPDTSLEDEDFTIQLTRFWLNQYKKIKNPY